MRILLIEDDEAIGSAVQGHIMAAGHAIDWAKTLFQARKYESTGFYELILLDVSLPDGNGIDYLRNRRQSYPTATIVMTARSEISNRIKVLSAGADEYMGKPFSMSELSARIAAVCQDGSLRHRVLATGGLNICLADRRLQRDGEAVDLTAGEWAVLDCLLHRPGVVVSEGTIEGVVYDFSEIDGNAVELCISRLRKKIGRRRIETIPGLGYRLVLN
ncbi:response regulator [Rhizobium leguminosarum]|uniref:Response regulator n=1 Tax=Rhizobium ruizarguesonis TaxID=2081791 RepID=A0AAE4YX17_9HYPH|nr:response regulator transcription factor [Rhizobium ruizarguesonis]NEI52877.1 response regulator [Rhizobium ruizarguesonis]